MARDSELSFAGLRGALSARVTVASVAYTVASAVVKRWIFSFPRFDRLSATNALKRRVDGWWRSSTWIHVSDSWLGFTGVPCHSDPRKVYILYSNDMGV